MRAKARASPFKRCANGADIREERENREGNQVNCNTCTQSHNIQGVARDLFPLSIVEDKITIRLHIATRVSSS